MDARKVTCFGGRAHGDGFQALEPELRTGAASPCGAAACGDGRGETDAGFAAGTDGEAFPKAIEGLFTGPRRGAFEFRAGHQASFKVGDFEADQGVACAGHEEAVPARFTQAMAEVSPNVGVDVDVGEGRARDDHGTSGRAHLRALEGAGEDQQRARRVTGHVRPSRDGMDEIVGCRFGRVPFDQDAGGQSLSAHALKAPRMGKRAGFEGVRAEVDVQHAAGEAVEAPPVHLLTSQFDAPPAVVLSGVHAGHAGWNFQGEHVLAGQAFDGHHHAPQ